MLIAKDKQNLNTAAMLIKEMERTLLYIIPPEQYMQAVMGIIKEQANNASIIYITTNKPYYSLVESFKNNSIDSEKIFFIDCVTQQAQGNKGQDVHNCLFLDSPSHITGLSVAINQAVKDMPGNKIVLLDSLSTLLIYNDDKVIGQFSHFFVNMMRARNASTILIALESDLGKSVIKTIESMADEVIKWHTE
jgi:KaiC/GvpD/RAD55 family RecA-like ATPase